METASEIRRLAAGLRTKDETRAAGTSAVVPPVKTSIALPPQWKPTQEMVDKLAGMNRAQRRAWMKRLENRKGWK